jgi:predicted amidohydrolase YtcJ
MFALFARNLHRDLARMSDDTGSGLIGAAGRKLSSFGISSACDADLRRETFAAFAAADAAGHLRQRIYGLIVHDQADAVPRGRHSGRLATEAVKIWADGGMSSRTAAIHGSYPVPPYGSGILSFERDELTAMVRDFDARGFQVCIHAQGDRAIETVLDAYAAVLSPRLAAGGGNPRRHRIEHGGAMYPYLTERAAALGIVIASQPGFLSSLGDGFAAAFPDSHDELYAFASWQRAGITVAGSSDSPVITADPRIGIRDARLRRTGDGRVLGPGERLSAREALALYTTQAAIACHREDEIGSLEPGKLADFTVLDGNPLEIEPERIPGLGVLATVLDGIPVYQSGDIFPGG